MLLLIATFVGANFVAVIFLVWMPSYLYRRFHMSIAMAGLNGSLYLSAASCVGVIFGGWLADALVLRRFRSGRTTQGARIIAQSLGLLMGGPFLFAAGFGSTASIVLVALACVGFCKGIYDSNIWASLYDVIPVRDRGIAAGIMNSSGWLGGGAASVVMAAASGRFGMGACISATAAIYLCFGIILCRSGVVLSRARLNSGDFASYTRST